MRAPKKPSKQPSSPVKAVQKSVKVTAKSRPKVAAARKVKPQAKKPGRIQASKTAGPKNVKTARKAAALKTATKAKKTVTKSRTIKPRTAKPKTTSPAHKKGAMATQQKPTANPKKLPKPAMPASAGFLPAEAAPLVAPLKQKPGQQEGPISKNTTQPLIR